MATYVPEGWCRCSKEGLNRVLGWMAYEKQPDGFYRIPAGQTFALEIAGDIWIHPDYVIDE